MFEPKVDLTRLEESVKRFEKKPLKKGMIVFYGDSGFTRWAPRFDGNPMMEEVLLGKNGEQAVVNNGFGTSTAEEQLYYYDRGVKAYEPRGLVLQAFGNDYGAGYTPLEIFFLQTRILDYARHDFPGLKLFLCNIRPTLKMKDSPLSRRTARAEFNELVADYCAKHGDTTLVDQFNCPVFYDEGFVCDCDHVRADMFIEDEVHYNPLGYTVYGEFFKEILKDVL
ncbi:MAG: hypothetical protein IJS65_06385 [Clostridia bacterium]|nr:hypothetical protein [Clostridia bacterium]